MKIQTGRVAYYFSTVKRLENFIKKYEGKISGTRMMSMVYSEKKWNTFNFLYDRERDIYSWQYCDREYYEDIGYEIITGAFQRSE